MKTVIGIALIVAALVFGYMGVQKWQDSSKSFEIGKLELSAQKESGMEDAYLLLGGAVILLAGGIIVLKK